MSDQKFNLYAHEMRNLGGMSNKRAVTLMMLALLVSPALVAIVVIVGMM